MNQLLNYALESTLILSIGYGIYYLCLRKLTFYAFNRGALFLILFASIAFPMASWELTVNESFISQSIPDLNISDLPPEQDHDAYSTELASPESTQKVETRHQESSINWFLILISIYLLVSSFLLTRFVWGIFRLIHLVKSGNKSYYEEQILIDSPHIKSAFSILNIIFVNSSLIGSPDLNTIVRHELVHIKSFHTVDRFIIELYKCVFWFNPIFYFFSNEWNATNEYFVDQKINNPSTKSEYVDLLLRIALFGAEPVPVNAFAKKPLKKRIQRLHTPYSEKRKAFSYLYLVCALIIVFGAVSCELHEATPQTSQDSFSSVEAFFVDEYGDQKMRDGKKLFTLHMDRLTFRPVNGVVEFPNKLKHLIGFINLHEELNIIQYGTEYYPLYLGHMATRKDEIKQDYLSNSLMPMDKYMGELFKKVDKGFDSKTKLISVQEYHLRITDLHELRFSFDNEGRIDGISPKLSSLPHYSFEYDVTNRLISSTTDEYACEYAYDDQGNLSEITKHLKNGHSNTYQFDYDLRGNIQNAYAYNNKGELEYSVRYLYQ